MNPVAARAITSVAGPTQASASHPIDGKLTLVQTPATRPAASRTGSKRGDAIAIAIACLVPVALTAWGWPYYVLARGARLRHPLHALLRPSGEVGLGTGILGLALFLFLWLYPFRKAARWLAWTGTVGSWMRVHVVAGLAIPLLVAVHAGWRFEGLIGLGYLSMFVVSLSGIVGRYLYVHIPRSRNGLEMSMEEVASERRTLVTGIAAATGLVPADVEQRLASDPRGYEGLDPVRTLWRMFRDDVARGRRLRELERELRRPRPGAVPLSGDALSATMRLARRELALSQQVRMLDATRRVFGWWHVAHRPFALTALFAVLIHVVVAVVVGGIGFGGGN